MIACDHFVFNFATWVTQASLHDLGISSIQVDLVLLEMVILRFNDAEKVMGVRQKGRMDTLAVRRKLVSLDKCGVEGIINEDFVISCSI